MTDFIGCGWSSGSWITITDYSDYYKIKNMCVFLLTGEKPVGQRVLKHPLRPAHPNSRTKLLLISWPPSNTNAMVFHTSLLSSQVQILSESWCLLAESHSFYVTEKLILPGRFSFNYMLFCGFQMDADPLLPSQRRSLPHTLRWNCLITSLRKSPNELFGQPILANSTSSVMYNFLLSPSPFIWSL